MTEILGQNEETQPEKNESGEINFKKIFEERFTAVEPISEEQKKYRAQGLESLGIQKLTKEVPAIVFRIPKTGIPESNVIDFFTNEAKRTEPFDLWIIDDQDKILEPDTPHWAILGDLAKFLNMLKTDLAQFTIDASIVQADNKLYLLLDSPKRFGVESFENSDTETGVALLDFLRKYNIQGVAIALTERGQCLTGKEKPKPKTIVDEDLLGKRRENLFYINLARKYNMTNSQYMKFRTITQAALYSDEPIPINYDDIAKQIVKEND